MMRCYVCGAADRGCTKCGRFFCGGHRLVGEGAGKGYHAVTRARCDGCTPDQGRMRAAKRFGEAATVVGVAAFVVASAVAGAAFLAYRLGAGR